MPIGLKHIIAANTTSKWTTIAIAQAVSVRNYAKTKKKMVRGIFVQTTNQPLTQLHLCSVCAVLWIIHVGNCAYTSGGFLHSKCMILCRALSEVPHIIPATSQVIVSPIGRFPGLGACVSYAVLTPALGTLTPLNSFLHSRGTSWLSYTGLGAVAVISDKLSASAFVHRNNLRVKWDFGCQRIKAEIRKHPFQNFLKLGSDHDVLVFSGRDSGKAGNFGGDPHPLMGVSSRGNPNWVVSL